MTRRSPIRIWKGLLATGLVLALLEGVASLAYFVWWGRMNYWRPLPERVHTVYDPELGWASEKGRVARDVFGPGLDVSTNALGFRNASEFSPEIPPGKSRVVALGDSFTLGYDVGDSDSWPAWLERLCPRLEVPNMGQSGYGIDQSYLWYRRDGLAIDQDVLVLAFIGDDLARVRHDDMLGYGKPVLRLTDGKLVAENVPVPRAPYLLPVLTQNLAIFEQLRLVQLPRAVITRLAPREAIPEVMSEAEAERLDEAIFRELARLAAERDARFLLVHLPHPAHGRPSEIEAIPAFGAAAIERVRSEGLVFADLRDELERVPDPERRELFQARTLENGAGAHYSAHGNRFIAAAIAARLAKLGWIPEPSCAEPEASSVRPAPGEVANHVEQTPRVPTQRERERIE